ncbi:cation diffusion facilitator family transporter [Desulforhopalus singaporensis]|uniref:Cation diffusion facilitator family transporter n=1 Tax=Desulforhopalus singaporensis TaxID=91360 RepID=A0A1H0RVQ5_9BACT|nr:cation diffusion facilitator family transporter [Desulforhopalus singaporensis]SDP33493.1 cation diffusion facilitator family transporter [Desulforhopalus singaporensis]
MIIKKRQQQGILAINVGLAANVLLAVMKTGVGIIGNSPALLADGINSTSDVAYGIVVKVFMHLSHKPADDEHPYGHDRLESIAAVVVGAFVITTGISIFWSSISKVYDLLSGQSDFASASRLALWIALFTVLLKMWLTCWTYKIGNRTSNSVILALAADHRNDIFTALAATIGIIFSQHGHIWVDPFAGGLVSVIILMTGVEIIRDSAADLMTTLPGKELTEKIHHQLADIKDVLDIEEIHGHRFGMYMVVNITIGVSPELKVEEGDRIATEVENRLVDEIAYMRRVFVHYHPVRHSPKPSLSGHHARPAQQASDS